MASAAGTTWDTIVVGLGGVGSAVLYELASRGQRVLGFEQFPCGHSRGSSHGQTRVIRQAYFEHPDYVPLLLRSYELWEQLERETGRRCMYRNGLLQVGPADGAVIRGVLQSAAEHQLAVEQLRAEEVRRRFPPLVIRDEWSAVYEAHAGYLFVEAAVAAHQAAAAKAGATIRDNEAVRTWRATDQGVSVTTDVASWSAAALVVTAGPWAGQLLADLKPSLCVLRKDLYWLAAAECYRQETGLPVFLYELSDGIYYGFPDIAGSGVKVGEHTGGVEHALPTSPPYELIPADVARVERFVAECLPQVTNQRLRHRVCWYTMSADGHFVVGAHPQHHNVYIAAGLSGHGYKFTPVLGEALADLVCQQRTRLPIEFLAWDRASA